MANSVKKSDKFSPMSDFFWLEINMLDLACILLPFKEVKVLFGHY